jgi:serine/threonine-protein kinase
MHENVATRSFLPSSPDSPWTVTLEVIQGPHAGQSFSFSNHDTFLVGRSRQTQFCLPQKDLYFSRFHFLLEVNPPLCRVVDLQSHNGTLVNGQKMTMADLKDGDEIRGGTTLMRVRIQGAARVLPATAGPASAIEDTADQLDEVVEEIALRRRAGEKPDVNDYLRRYPKLGGALHLALQADDLPPVIKTAEVLPSIPGYRIEWELGRGGMGVVFKAVRELDQRKVALKTITSKLKKSKESGERFLREARILRELQHPHIVSFLDMGQTEHLLYFAMELVPGFDAGKLVRKTGPLPVGRATRIILQVIDGLAFAHVKGFVHRDLKPANILVVEEGDRDLAKVADFGLARAYQESPLSGLTMSRDVMGTPQFMPPEQILSFRSVKPTADQYATAATLYFLLTGAPHFDVTANLQGLYKRILQEDPVRVEKRCPELPRELAEIIHRGLAREPSNRFLDIVAFRKALEPFG